MGTVLQCVLTPKVGDKLRAAATAPVRLGEGLFDYVNTLVGKGGGEFNVVIVQLNGAMQVRVCLSAEMLAVALSTTQHSTALVSHPCTL